MIQASIPPSFSRDELSVVCCLGKGAFGNVLQVDGPDVKDRTDDSDGEDSDQVSGSGRRRSYALKQLHTEGPGEKSFVVFANEVKVLCSLPAHENIIQIHGLSINYWENPGKGFLLLELMAETLEESLQRCCYSRSSGKQFQRRFPWLAGKSTKVLEQHDRVRGMAVGVAKGLCFLHAHNIIYRDLKPANVGVSFDGTLCLMDFGLAKHVTRERCSHRRLTGSTGTMRYMAPEVALNENYNFSADVYSFAILLWEICTLKKPFANVTDISGFIESISRAGSRPPARSILSPIAKNLVKACWNQYPERRPSMASVVKELETI